MSATLTYVFCLVRSTRRPALHAPAHGLAGAGDLRLLPAWRSTWLVVASVPERAYGAAPLAAGMQDLQWIGRKALAHEAVIEQFLTSPAVLPMQLFTLFTSDERALAHVQRSHAKIDRILERIDRQHEWGLRLTLDEKAVRPPAAAVRAPVTGAGYLQRRRDLLGQGRAHLAQARTEAARLFRTLSREATGARRRRATERVAPGARLLLDAAFLVPVRRTASFRAALRRSARGFRTAGIVVSLSGPWPPYNFV